ncbi:hypothetical protein Trydic_g4624 [Trypoxylus dichotomus]
MPKYVEMKLVTIDDVPVYHIPRPLPFVEREIVDKQVSEWIKEGIVETCASEYSSQVVVIKKKEGTPRICIDYRKINKKIVKDRYPLLLIEDQLDKLQNARVFSTLDLRNGFLHVNVEENSTLETTNKRYKHILGVIDGFTKFVCPYPIKSTTSSEVIEKFRLQQNTFGNYGPSEFMTKRMIYDPGGCTLRMAELWE